MTKQQILQQLSEIIPEPQLQIWLNTENPAFGNKKPLDLINSGDTFLILQMIAGIDYGVAN